MPPFGTVRVRPCFSVIYHFHLSAILAIKGFTICSSLYARLTSFVSDSVLLFCLWCYKNFRTALVANVLRSNKFYIHYCICREAEKASYAIPEYILFHPVVSSPFFDCIPVTATSSQTTTFLWQNACLKSLSISQVLLIIRTENVFSLYSAIVPVTLKQM